MRRVIVLLFFFFLAFIAKGTHIRCGEITLIKQTGLTYRITLLVYTNTATEIRFGDGTLDFGDGSKPHITPTIDNTMRPDLGLNVGMLMYSLNHTFPETGSYTVSYTESNLDAGIINVSNSIETRFYLESGIYVDANTDSSSPLFLTEPNFKQPIGQEYSYATSAADKNDNKLTYELVSPLHPENKNFSWPENINVNFYNGLVTWDTKYKGEYKVGEYLFAVRVTQYNSEKKKIGHVMRTFQVVLMDANSQINITNPIGDSNGKIVVENNEKKTIKVVVENTTLPAEWIITFDQKLINNFSFAQYDSVVVSGKLRVALLKFNSTSTILRDNPYPINLRAKSTGPSGVFSKDISYLFFTKNVELPVITEIQEQGADEVIVYPNPFSNFLKIDFEPDDQLVKYELLNGAGQLLNGSQIGKEDMVETSQLAPGLYIFRIKSRRKIRSQILIKN